MEPNKEVTTTTRISTYYLTYEDVEKVLLGTEKVYLTGEVDFSWEDRRLVTAKRQSVKGDIK